MVTVTLDRFGRIVIPKEIRERYGWAPGSKLALELDDSGVHVERLASAESGRGLVLEHGHLAFHATWTGPTTMSAEQVRSLLEGERDTRNAEAFESEPA